MNIHQCILPVAPVSKLHVKIKCHGNYFHVLTLNIKTGGGGGEIGIAMFNFMIATDYRMRNLLVLQSHTQ